MRRFGESSEETATAVTIAPAAHSSYLPVRPDWLADWHESILEPALPMVDPHHHL
jgi:hypothetical protein